MANESFRVVSGNAAGTQITLGDEFQIGRAAPAEGRLGDDPELSRAHAKVTRNPQGQFVIEDLGSTNGTAVNGQRISGPTVLKPGDTVQLGKSTLQFQGEGADLQKTALGAAPAGAAPAAAATPPPPPPPPGPPTGPTQPLGAGPQAPPPGGAGRPPGAPPPPTAAGGNGGGKKGIFIGIGALALVAAVVVAVLLLAGGGDDDGGGDSAAAQEEVEQTLESFAAASDCDELTDDAIEEFFGEAEDPRQACDDAVEPEEDFEINTVEVDGDEANAEVELGGEDADVELVNEDDEWLINDLSGPAVEAAMTDGGTETTPAPAPEPEPEEEPDPRRAEAIATLEALVEAVQSNDEAVFCGLLSPRQAQRLVGGPGGDAAIARCVEVAADVDLSENVPSNIDVTGVRISGNQASVRLTTGERFTLVRRGGRYVINTGLG
jgi:pSer/pThr/pTyr-binding forkhead associated (FHA) protein